MASSRPPRTTRAAAPGEACLSAEPAEPAERAEPAGLADRANEAMDAPGPARAFFSTAAPARDRGAAAPAVARAGRGVLLYAGLSGSAHGRNDDRWQVAAEIGLLMVADGVSGYPAGDVAAELAVRTACQLLPDLLRHGLEPSEALARAMAVCNEEIREFAAIRPDCTGMATTLVCALIQDGSLHLAHVGDSRAYRLRDGSLSRLTRDHSVGQQIVDAGRLTEAEVVALPAHGILTRALGLAERVEPEVACHRWGASDMLLLCSDGLTGALSDPILEHLLQTAAPQGPAAQVHALIGGALQAGATANATALVASAAECHGPGPGPDRPH